VVLTTNLGYGGIEIGLRRLADLVGYRVVTIGFERLDDVVHIGERITDAVSTHRPAVVVLDEITSDTALLLPVNDLAAAIREISPATRVVVDGAHSGMLARPAIDAADVWVTNLHKWPCAARGAAVIAAARGAEVGPLQSSWTGEETYPDSFTWTGTDDRTAFLTAPLALRILDLMRTSGLDMHIAEVLDKACSALSAEWDVATDARPESMRAPWMRLVELSVPGPRTYEWAASVMTTARSLDLDVAVTFFGEDAYVRLSAHGYNQAADYERVAELPALLAQV
jgi:isopenicillin-N epimerase